MLNFLRKASQEQDKDPRESLLLKLVPNQIVLSSRVPPIGEPHKEKLRLLERVMRGILEVMMEKILPREKMKSLMQSIILKYERKFKGPQRNQNKKYSKIWRTWKLIFQSIS